MRILVLLAVIYAGLIFWNPRTANTFACSQIGGNSAQVFIRVEMANPWIFWNVGKGSVTIEDSNGLFEYHPATFTSLEVSFPNKSERKSYFSLISHRISLYDRDGAQFKGICQKT
jgi:hypothetical protein